MNEKVRQRVEEIAKRVIIEGSWEQAGYIEPTTDVQRWLDEFGHQLLVLGIMDNPWSPEGIGLLEALDCVWENSELPLVAQEACQVNRSFFDALVRQQGTQIPGKH